MKEYKEKHFPDFMKMLEDKLQKNNYKYLCGDEMTLADIIVASHLFKVVSNDEFQEGYDENALESYEHLNSWFDEIHDKFNGFNMGDI